MERETILLALNSHKNNYFILTNQPLGLHQIVGMPIMRLVTVGVRQYSYCNNLLKTICIATLALQLSGNIKKSDTHTEISDS